MSLKTSSTSRNSRQSPYQFEEFFVQFHRSAAGAAWRWRTELTLIVTMAAGLWRLALLVTIFWAGTILASFVTVVLAVAPTRRFTVRRFWCVLARHRLQRVCYETRMHTRAGRIPLILWIRPTSAGMRAHVLCRAGICAQDFADNAAKIAAACYSRAAQVTPNRNWSHLLTIDIMRGDLLHAKRIIPARIAHDITTTSSQGTHLAADAEDVPPALSA